jgi:acyl carrier protein
MLSSPQLGAYSAANVFLDALSYHRRAEGLPALTVNWAFLTEVGMAARHMESGHAAMQGSAGFTPEEGLDVLERLLGNRVTQAGVLRMDWSRWRETHPLAAVAPLLSGLFEAGPGSTRQARSQDSFSDREIRSRVLSAGHEDRPRVLCDYLRRHVSGVLQLPAARLDLDQPLNQLGFDSLMAIELKGRLEDELALVLPVDRLLRGPSVAQLAAELGERIATDEALLVVRGPGAAGMETATAECSDWEVFTI